jgi:CBS domain containing-hemolysin-like protein
LAKLQNSRQPLIGVVDDEDKIVGIITLENLAEYLMVTQASREQQRRGDHSGLEAR